MEIKRFYLGCLAHASYLVFDDGEAAVIDPQRDVSLYLDEARELGVKIRWVIETHLHADFVSGHLELAERSGATICMGAGSGALFEHRALQNDEKLPLGKDFLRILSTPGHTEESICIVALEQGRPKAVFTGDTLFIGDVGRPDLSPTRTPQELAGLLYDSVHDKLLMLPDDTVVYPAHGAGSLCGKQMSNEASSTIGKERRFNYALQAKSRDQFVSLLTGEMPPRPEYFHDEVERNRAGAAPLEALPSLPSLSPDQVLERQAKGAVVLDTRPTEQFAAAHLPGSIHIALSGQFASWAARILGIGAEVVLVTEDAASLAESRLRLARVGLENVSGYLDGGILAWIEAGKLTEFVDQISARDAAEWIRNYCGEKAVLDVRERSERIAGAITGSVSIPLPQLEARLGELDPKTALLVHCKSGYRSSIATSLLQSRGFAGVINMTGGYDAWALSFPEGAPVGHEQYPVEVLK
jgi:glyoxylase-like metal-dependent hydrolase (beta-lactamase superfamily II)/rhodanese-related sulfurtransferase